MLRRIPAPGPIQLIVDSTGLSIVGQGAWAVAKHGGHGKRGWKKLHLGVDRSGVIVAQALTDAPVDDATTAVDLIPSSMAISQASPRMPPTTRSRSTRRRARAWRTSSSGIRRSSGDGLRARSAAGQGAKAVLACHVLNRMRDLGRPALVRDQGVTNSWVGIVAGHGRFMQQGRAGWRTRSSATRPALAMAFAPGVQRGRGVRSSSAVRSSIG